MKKVNLTPRLAAILSLIEGDVLADIGTDHSYLPIAACFGNRVNKAIACDVNQGPLERAKENIRHAGLENSIETRLGDGLAPLRPGEADIISVSGMGGMKMIDMINQCPNTARQAKRLIFQPQHDVVRLRKVLHESGFDISGEEVVKEENRFYIILTAVPVDKVTAWTEMEYRWGKHLIAKKSAVWQEYLAYERDKIKKYIHKVPEKQKEELEKFGG